jgi:mono/diheme cytochrome c family protein
MFGLFQSHASSLVGTQMTQKQMHGPIRDGKTDAMPGFRRTLTEVQIEAFTTYIKGLKAPE